MRSRKLRYVALLALASVFALACGQVAPPGAVDESVDPGQALERKQAQECEPGKEHWRASGAPKRGGVFRWAAPSTGLRHLDVSAPGGGTQYYPQVYSHLVQARACFYEDTMMVPGLAKSWEVSSDGTTWTLKLRDDVRWHNQPPVNGRPFTAADVAWTIDHQKQGGLLRSVWANVSHGEPDASTVVLRLTQPDADFLGASLGERYNVMLPREIKEQFGDFKTAAVGTGPYMLKDFKPDTHTILERNPNWREQGADGKLLPYIDGVQVIGFGDYSAQVAAVRSGQLELNNVQGFLKLESDTLKQTNPKLIPYADQTACPWGLQLNVTKKPLDDPRVRKAIALALDLEEIVEGVQRGGAVRSGFLPSGIREFAWSPEKVKEKFPYDPKRAKELLAEAGYAPGQIRLVLTVGNSGSDQPQAEAAQKYLEAVGINVQIDLYIGNSSTYMSSGDLRKSGDMSWGTVTPCTYFPNRWLEDALRSNGSRNVIGLSDPKVDALAAAQAKEFDRAKRKQIIDQLQDYLYEIMPFVPSDSRIYYRFYGCSVKNMRPTDWHGHLTGITEAWLDPSAC